MGTISDADLNAPKDTRLTPDQEIQGLKSFVSFLHIVLVKVFRDREPNISFFIPDDHLGYDLVLTVKKAPSDLTAPDLFIEQATLERSVTHPVTEADIEKIVREASEKATAL